jgi:hypothetical protein
MSDQPIARILSSQENATQKNVFKINLRLGMTRPNKIKQYKKLFTHHPLTMLLHETSFLIQTVSEEKQSSTVAILIRPNYIIRPLFPYLFANDKAGNMHNFKPVTS